MNELQIFKNEEFGDIRTVVKDGEPMFCLADVCKALEISNVSQLKTRLKEDGVITNEVGVVTGRKADGSPAYQKVKMNFINESNLYKTIFQSRKESAERFTDWVTSEVLPSIRKHGVYAVDELINNPEMAIKAFTALKEEREKNKLLQADNERMKPKEIFADAVSASHTSILVGELAKLLKQNGIETGQRRLFSWMRNNGYLIKSGSSKNMPTQKSMEFGLLEIKEGSYINGNGANITTKTPKVTGKGQQYFINKFLGDNKADYLFATD